MVKFKTIKYKHVRRARELLAQVGSEEEETALIMSLVDDWDYKDEDSGEKIPPGSPDELSVDQYNEVVLLFERATEGGEVKKTNVSNSPYGSMQSREEKTNSQMPQNG